MIVVVLFLFCLLGWTCEARERDVPMREVEKTEIKETEIE